MQCKLSRFHAANNKLALFLPADFHSKIEYRLPIREKRSPWSDGSQTAYTHINAYLITLSRNFYHHSLRMRSCLQV